MPSTTTVTITESGAQTTTITPSASQEVSVSFAGAGTTYTDASARAAISVVGGSGLSYNSTTGAVSYAQQNLALAKISDAGTAASLAHGVAEGNLVRLIGVNGVTKLPALDGSLLTNISGTGGGSGDMTGVDITAGNGLDITQANTTSGDYTATISADLKANGGVVVESTELAVDLGASAITGTLAVADGGTGLTSISTLLNSNQAYSDISGTPTLGTAAAAATGDFEASGAIGIHNNITTAHGISTFGSTLVDDANAAAARTTLGAAASNHGHTLAQITDLDVGARAITTTTTNGNIVIDPPGTGFLQVEGATNPGKIRLMCEQGSHGVGLVSPAHTVQADYDLTLPTATGAANQALKTDGAGQLGWSTLGTAAAAATGDFVAATAVSTFGGTLIDDADAAAARTTLGVTNTGSYTGQIETAADKDYILDPAVATARTISAFYIKVNSGSGTVVAKLYNGSDLVKQVTASTSTGNQTSLANTSLAADAVLKLELSAASATDVIFSVEYTE